MKSWVLRVVFFLLNCALVIVWLLGLWVPSGTWTLNQASHGGLLQGWSLFLSTQYPLNIVVLSQDHSPLWSHYLSLHLSHVLPIRSSGWGLVFSKHFLSTGALSISLRNQDFGSQENNIFSLPQTCHISPWRQWGYSLNCVVWIEDT